MINMIWKYEAEDVSKIFFLEDDEMLEIIETYCKRLSGGNRK